MKYPLATLLLFLAALSGPVQAAQTGPVQVSHAWIRVLPGELPAGGYATLRNVGDTPSVLIGARSPDYRQVMLHESTTHNGQSSMSMVERLPLPPHGMVRLAPGGYHLMLMQALHPVKVGDLVKVTLLFADGRALDVEFLARAANAVDDQ